MWKHNHWRIMKAFGVCLQAVSEFLEGCKWKIEPFQETHQLAPG